MGAFNVYNMCMSGGARYECCTVIEPMCRDRLRDDPEATGQRWYCPCTARHKVAFGVLCDIVSGELRLYCRAEFPPNHMQDAKFMMFEKTCEQRNTPEEPFDQLPRVSPMERGSFITSLPQPGHYNADRVTLLNLPVLNWNQHYNLVKIDRVMGTSSMALGLWCVFMFECPFNLVVMCSLQCLPLFALTLYSLALL